MVHSELLSAHFVATWFLVGLIWLVQLVHYPLMKYVADERFKEFERQHCNRIGWIVAPLMIGEAGTGILIFVLGVSGVMFQVSLILIVLIWLSTALLQMPLHNRLSQRFDPHTHARLVSSNWIRTVAWTMRGFLVLPLIEWPSLPG